MEERADAPLLAQKYKKKLISKLFVTKNCTIYYKISL